MSDPGEENPRDDNSRDGGSREQLATRIQTMVDREIEAVDKILKTLDGEDAVATEGAARTLASLARTLRELVALDASQLGPEPEDDDPVPEDIDEFRRELARRIDAFIQHRMDSGVPGDPESRLE